MFLSRQTCEGPGRWGRDGTTAQTLSEQTEWGGMRLATAGWIICRTATLVCGAQCKITIWELYSKMIEISKTETADN